MTAIEIHVRDGRVRFYTMNGNDCTKRILAFTSRVSGIGHFRREPVLLFSGRAGRYVLMPRPNNSDPFPPRQIAHRHCPACGLPMFLSLIEPTYQRGYDVGTFECLSCAYAEMALIDFDQEMVASFKAGR